MQSEAAEAPKTLDDLVLSVRHPAHEIETAANVAYWLNSYGERGVNYQLDLILEQAERLAAAVADLRERVLADRQAKAA